MLYNFPKIPVYKITLQFVLEKGKKYHQEREYNILWNILIFKKKLIRKKH